MRKFTGVLMAITALVIQAAGAQGQQPPASLVDVGEFGENIYDLTKAKDWVKVGQKMKALEDATKKLAIDLKGAETGQKRLGMTLKALGKAIAAKDEQATKREANMVTLIAADLIEPFNPEIPAAVTRLDYYGRELEIWVLAKDTGKLKTTGDAMRATWGKLQPAVKSKGGNAEAKRFNDLMGQVAAAKAVDDYARITTLILDQVDNLEKVFKKK
jgi:hypothetical protein